MTSGATKFSKFPQAVQQQALENAQRLASGKRLAIESREVARARDQLLFERTDIRRSIESATAEKVLARESGFRNVEEFRVARGITERIGGKPLLRPEAQAIRQAEQQRIQAQVNIQAQKERISITSPRSHFGEGQTFTELTGVETESERAEKLFRETKFRDINLFKTFFPNIAREEGKTGGINVQTFIERKGQLAMKDFDVKVSKPIIETPPPLKIILPPFFGVGGTGLGGAEFNLKDILSKETEIPSGFVTSQLKFGFFQIALPTTTEVISGAIAKGEIVPVIKTTFKANIKQLDDILQSDIVSISKAGGRTEATISKQIIKQQGDDIFIAQGRAVTGAKAGTKTEFTISDVIGVGSRGGKARLVTQLDDTIILSSDLGTGVTSKGVSLDLIKITQRRGLGGISTRTNLPTIKNLKLTKDIKFSDKLTGVLIKTSDDDITKFIGTTSPTKIKFSFDKGLTKTFSLDDINVQGKIDTKGLTKIFIEDTSKGILTKDIPADDLAVFFGKGGKIDLPTLAKFSTKDPISKVITSTGGGGQKLLLNQQVQEKVVSSIGANVLKSVGDIQKSIVSDASKVVFVGSIKTSITPSVSTLSSITNQKITLPKQDIQSLASGGRFQDLTGISKFPSQTSDRFGSLGVLGSRLDTGTRQGTGLGTSQGAITSQDSLTKILTKQKALLKTILKTIQPPRTKQDIIPTIKTQTLTKQLQAQRQAINLRLRSRARQTFRQGKFPTFITPRLPRSLKTPKGIFSFLRGRELPKLPSGRFPVFVRRKGLFKFAGFGKTRKRALVLGQRIAKTTLARSFFIGGRGATPLKLPGFRTKREKGRNIFIQKAKSPFGSTLGTPGELKEIQIFKALSIKKKSKKRRK